jgi:uncharacterized membrane protein
VFNTLSLRYPAIYKELWELLICCLRFAIYRQKYNISLSRGEISKASIAIYWNYALNESDSFEVAHRDHEKKNGEKIACLKVR